MTAAAAAHSVSPAPEDSARADLYALLAHLFYAPPTPNLLAAIAASDDIAAHASQDTPLAQAWHRLQQACEIADPQAVGSEYAELFLGVGKAEVPLNASWYLTGFFNDAPLVAVRAGLAELGLSRLQSANETEDHIAALAESMRLLVVGGQDVHPAPVTAQKAFFMRHVGTWYGLLAQRLDATEGVNFYALVGALMKSFLDTEAAQFDNY